MKLISKLFSRIINLLILFFSEIVISDFFVTSDLIVPQTLASYNPQFQQSYLPQKSSILQRLIPQQIQAQFSLQPKSFSQSFFEFKNNVQQKAIDIPQFQSEAQLQDSKLLNIEKNLNTLLDYLNSKSNNFNSTLTPETNSNVQSTSSEIPFTLESKLRYQNLNNWINKASLSTITKTVPKFRRMASSAIQSKINTNLQNDVHMSNNDISIPQVTSNPLSNYWLHSDVNNVGKLLINNETVRFNNKTTNKTESIKDTQLKFSKLGKLFTTKNTFASKQSKPQQRFGTNSNGSQIKTNSSIAINEPIKILKLNKQNTALKSLSVTSQPQILPSLQTKKLTEQQLPHHGYTQFSSSTATSTPKHNFKLIYFDARGICEPIRLLFHYAKVSFEDSRITRRQWLALKDSTIYGKVPILEVDGKPLTYCHTISRFLARTFGLAGTSSWEQAKVDEISDFHSDVAMDMQPYLYVVAGFHQGDRAALRKAIFLPGVEKHFPVYVNILKQSGSGFFVNSGLTWIDFVISEYMTTIKHFEPAILDKYPAITRFVRKVQSLPAIFDYIANREHQPVK